MRTKNICLVHGWGADTQKLQPLKEELEKLGWKVSLPQLPFFELPEPKNPWTLKDFTNYIDSCSGKFFKNGHYSLFGHSLGGRIAIKMALENPSKLDTIILCSAAGISRTNVFKRFFFKIIAKLSNPFKKLSPSFLSLLKKVVYRIANATDYRQIASETKRQTFKNIIEENLKTHVTKIKLPTLILWGEQDKITPIKDAYFLRENITKSTLEVFPNENHRLPYHQSQNTALKIDSWFQSL